MAVAAHTLMYGGDSGGNEVVEISYLPLAHIYEVDWLYAFTASSY